ncbi:DNA repair and recombination protein RadB [Methanospirillum sp.]|uniref:DNA repair and recombination protein RadB n=1 Tax=Methanospirillum sp. TaxID=45200 RepID=UPI002D1FC0C3|nr:DNA repair and recombination protein RadB [Methanospirillum sp.]
MTGVSSGNSELDALMGTGYPRRMITQIFGEPGSGKSTLCLMAAVSALRLGESVVYFDTESFSAERFSQIAGDEAENLAERLFLYEPSDFTQQAMMIHDSEEVIREQKAGLIILDSATGLYRTELEHIQEALQKFNRQMVILLGYAKRYDIPVLITNQVYMDISRGDFAPLGGTGLYHLCKIILQIERRDSMRRIRVMKHHARPEGAYIDVLLVQEGVRIVDTYPDDMLAEKP